MEENGPFDMGNIDIAWCPGCGNFGILRALKRSLEDMALSPSDVVIVSGIGQAAKTPHYLRCHIFNGLHGRALPPATAIKSVNPGLTVIAESGDGDMFGEGGNHFIHAIRRNPDITNIVHDNMIYGLTKGQASPTSMEGMETPVQVSGVILEPFNPLSTAIALGAGFVARTFSKDVEMTMEVIKEAIRFKGYALVDILQPCVSFNRLNTFQWFEEHTETIDDDHDVKDRVESFRLSLQRDPLPVGIFYKNGNREAYHDLLDAYKDIEDPLWNRVLDRREKLEKDIGELH